VDRIYAHQRGYLGLVGASAPLFLVNGNHEQAARYRLDGRPDNPSVLAGRARVAHFPLPAPDAFYTGNAEPVEHVGLPRDYYAWTWGDALFVTLDPYWHSKIAVDGEGGAKRGRGEAAGKGKGRDLWDVTLGEAQYRWLEKTLATSQARWKFVFAHHVHGTGRGAVEQARLYEWGGQDPRGGDVFAQKRPGWSAPVHGLFVRHGVTIFFQGHDHLYAWEKMDDLVYQEVPMPSDTSYEIGVLANADAYTDLTLDGSGHLRVTVESDCVSVDYVAAYLPADTLDVHKNREIRHTYKVCEGAVSTGGGYSVDSPFFEIFPNPAKGNLNIRAKSDIAHDRRIDLFSLQGQMLRSGVLPAGEESCAIPLPGLSTGIYWVKLTGHDKSSFQKLMIEQD
jgi:hypothetical protein